DVARGAEQELRELLRTSDFARGLVADRPAAIAGNAARTERARGEPLAAHRLDRIAPDLRDVSDDHGGLLVPGSPHRNGVICCASHTWRLPRLAPRAACASPRRDRPRRGSRG